MSKRKYTRNLSTATFFLHLREIIRARLRKYIKNDDETGCWLWQGSLTKGGYGKLHIRPHVWSAHRLAYELWRGLIPCGYD